MFGTKCPSITSRWIQSAPATSTARTSSPSFEKSDARIEGARTRDRGGRGMTAFRTLPVRQQLPGLIERPAAQKPLFFGAFAHGTRLADQRRVMSGRAG